MNMGGCTFAGVYGSCVYLHACQVRVTVGDSGLLVVCPCDIFRALTNFIIN